MFDFPSPTPYVCKDCRSEVYEEKGVTVTHDNDGEPKETPCTIQFCSNPICVGHYGMEWDEMECVEGDLVPEVS